MSIVCLGCGYPLEREAGEEGYLCVCPPPMAPPSSRARGFYRDLPQTTPCPRCQGAIASRELHDVSALECTSCLGLFLSADVVQRITSDEGRETRLAFPRRDRVEESTRVRYIPCLVCQKPMNRTNFAKVSGVIVDVCKDDGVWFDAGEINAIIDFVEAGGMERAKKRAAADKVAETQRLAKQREDLHKAELQSYARMGHPVQTGEPVALRALFDWW